MAKTIIGLVGPIASGKGTVVDNLEEKGYSSYSLSDRIREEIRSRGQEVTRETLNTVSNELRITFGANILAQRTAEIIEKENLELVVVDSIRNPEEISYLKQRFDAKIIGVVAPQEKRFEFFKNRTTNSMGISSWEEFKTLDDKELKQEGEHKQQVKACLELADFTIENNGTIEDLKGKIEEILTQISGPSQNRTGV